LERVRAPSRAFCRRFDFPAESLDELEGPPLFAAIPVSRDGRTWITYRWLGGGRGGPYVQPEIHRETGEVVVYGGTGDAEFGPWSPP
jgi:hypothetical protein